MIKKFKVPIIAEGRFNTPFFYKKAINLFPLSGEGYWSLANLKTYKFSSKEISLMEKSLNKDIQDQEKIQMLFALAKAYETKKDYKKSFSYYKDGNWMQRKIVEYNANENADSVDLIINFFNSHKDTIDFYSGHKNNHPIFILGLPRAGSTLLEQILSSHSQIEGTQELHNIMTIGRKIKTLNDSGKFGFEIGSPFKIKFKTVLHFLSRLTSHK